MEILISLMPIVVVIGLGYIIKGFSIFNDSFMNGLQKLVLNFMLPVSILLSFATSSFTKDDIVLPILLGLTVILMYFISKIFMKAFNIKNKFFPVATSLFEGGLIGYTLYVLLFPTPLSSIVSIDVGQGVVGFSLMFPALHAAYHGKTKGGALGRIKEFFTTPIILAIIFGILLSELGWLNLNSTVNQIFTETCSFIAGPSSVLVLLCLGYKLGFSKDIILTGFKLATLRCGINFFGCMVMLIASELIVGLSTLEAEIIIFIFSLPCSFLLTNFFNDSKDEKVAATTTSISVIYTLIFFVVMKAVFVF